MGKVEILTDMMAEAGAVRAQADGSDDAPASAPRKDVALDVARFRDGEDEKFRVSSKREMRLMLQDIARLGARVLMYYGDDDFVITTLLGADEDGIWLETGPYPEANEAVLRSDRLTFVSAHRQVKIQFAVPGVVEAQFGEAPAFHADLPDHLLRLQRREFFRSDIPPAEKARCIIPVPQDDPDRPLLLRSAPIADIGNGGVQLLCGGSDTALQPHSVFADCMILLPESDPLPVTLEVRNSSDFSAADGSAGKRVGCRFLELDRHTDVQLQRHVTRLQRENLARLRA